MIAGVLRLSRGDIKSLKITDQYSLHRVVYSLFSDDRSVSEKSGHAPSGFLFADKGGDFSHRQIIFLSDRQPLAPDFGEVETKPISASYLQHELYRFEVRLNPSKRQKDTGKTVPIKGREAIGDWFAQKAPKSWGFIVNREQLDINHLAVEQFKGKDSHAITLSSATISGALQVVDRELFISSFKTGLGRGRAFGFGLLQITPITFNPIN